MARRGIPRGERIKLTGPSGGGPIAPYPGGGGRSVGIQNNILTSVEEQSQVVGGQNNPLRIVYGRQILGADVAAIGDHLGNMILLCVWCEGEVDAVEHFWCNGEEPNLNIIATHYTGTASQGVDPRLALAFTRGLFSFTDRMPNVCYSVFEIAPGLCSGFPQMTALIRGLKVSSEFNGAKAYTQNPAYCIADFIESTRYGMGRSVDWASVATVATYCDEMIGAPSEKRHQFSLVIDKPQPVESWLTVMRDYADCWILPEGSGYRLVLDSTGTLGATKVITGISQANPMRITAVAHGFANGAIVKIAGIQSGMVEANGKFAVIRLFGSGHFDMMGIDSSSFGAWTADGTATQIGVSAFSFNASNIVAGSFSAQKRGVMDSPTIVEVDYTDTSTYPWRTDTTDPVFIPGIYDNPPSVPFRRTSVVKTGLTRYSEANRYAIELLNSGILDDLSVRFQAFDMALTLQAGDIVDVTHPLGLDYKIMRVQSIEAAGPGRWNIAAIEHDDAKYSTEVVSGPTTVDTTLPSPLHPPSPAGLQLIEVVTQTGTGDFISQISATWNDVSPPSGNYPFVMHYRVDVYDGETLKETGTVQRVSSPTALASYLTAALPEGILYTVRVYTISSLSIASSPASASLLNNGKSALPSDVPSIDGYEVGGIVFLHWEPATDFDLTGYWLKWGSTSDSWATATTLDRVSAIRYETKSIPEGTIRFFIKALDSVRSGANPFGQESANAAYCDVVVTADSGAFLVSNVVYVSPSVYQMARVGGGWVTNMGESWNSLFPSALNGYTDALWTYHASGTSSLLSEIADAGTTITGSWSAAVDYSDISGTATAQLELIVGGDTPQTIIDVAFTTPEEFNVPSHGFTYGDEILHVGCNTGATPDVYNGRFIVDTIPDSDTYTLKRFDGTSVIQAGSHSYASSSGTASRWPWSSYTTLSAKATARYSRLRVTTTTTGTILVRDPIGTSKCAVKTRTDGGFFTSSNLAGIAITFVQPFTKLQAISVTASGATGNRGAYDNVTGTGFDGYVIDTGGNKVNGIEASWIATGV